MTEFEMIQKLCEIDIQLTKSKALLVTYVGRDVPTDSNIARLYKVTKLLMDAKRDIRHRLMLTYGVFYM